MLLILTFELFLPKYFDYSLDMPVDYWSPKTASRLLVLLCSPQIMSRSYSPKH